MKGPDTQLYILDDPTPPEIPPKLYLLKCAWNIDANLMACHYTSFITTRLNGYFVYESTDEVVHGVSQRISGVFEE